MGTVLGVVILITSALEWGKDRKMLGAHWLAILGELVSLTVSEDGPGAGKVAQRLQHQLLPQDPDLIVSNHMETRPPVPPLSRGSDAPPGLLGHCACVHRQAHRTSGG